jgi:quercetin dioxygenase-like cupin family protein
MTSDLGDLEHREARLGEPTITGGRWWPNEADRLVSLYEAGRTLSGSERAAAERELAARARRAATPPVLRRDDVVFETSSYKGIEVGSIISQHLGIEVRNISLEIYRLLPGAHTESHRHNEAVYHVLNGRGWSVIDEKRYDWGPHDSIHVQKGAWHQFFNASTTEPAHLLVGAPSPIIEHLSPFADVFKGDSFSDMPDDFEPEHPFTHERVPVSYVGGQKWMSDLQMATHQRRAEREEVRKKARVILPANEAEIQRSEHRGDWKVGLIDRHLGFDNRILAMYVHQMPPDSHTETHKHGEAVVYVLSGRGYSIVEGERFTWRAGDCIFVKPGQWHQHFNSDPERVSQHLALYIQPLAEHVYENAALIEFQPEDDYAAPEGVSSSQLNWWE